MVKRWGQTDKEKLRYGSLSIWGAIGKQNSAEGPECIQNEPPQSHLQHIKILAWLIQMRNGEKMGSNRQIEADIWQFGYMGGMIDTRNSVDVLIVFSCGRRLHKEMAEFWLAKDGKQ